MSEIAHKVSKLLSSEGESPAPKLDSMLDISSSSVETTKCDKSIHNPEEVERLVLQVLEQLQSKVQFGDINTLMSLIVPKVMLEMQTNESLQDELGTIKESLSSQIQQSKVVSEDIAEIFLDLHNIYSKLEKFEKRGMVKKDKNKKFLSRISEASKFLKTTKHYINNDNNQLPGTSVALTTTSSPNFITPCRADEILSRNETNKAEKRAFLSNMLIVKKSDFSLHLNRKKQFYAEAESALKFQQKPKTEGV